MGILGIRDIKDILSGKSVFSQFHPEDVLSRQRFVLFRIYSLSAALAAIGIFIKMCVMFSHIQLLHYSLPILAIIIIINFYAAKKTGDLWLVYLVVLLASFALLHIVGYSTGGIRSASILYYPVIILYAFMLLDKRYGQFFAVLCCLQVMYIFIISRYTQLISFDFLGNNDAHIEEDFLFNGLFVFVIITAQSIYLYSGRNIVIQKITEQRDELVTKNNMLQEINNNLNKTNKELDKFVYSVTHDLRAPLSSILGLVQLTAEGMEEGFVKDNLGMIRSGALRLDNFILDILAYSRNIRMGLAKDSIDFQSLIGDVCATLKYMDGPDGRVEVTTKIEQATPFVSDKNRIDIVLKNLVSNAVRYNNPKASQSFVHIRVLCDEKQAVITVEDNGIGIKKELQQKVFDMFYRVAENSIGSGLGLYLVKETVEKLNGSISLLSEPGTGSTFTVIIPNLINN